MPAAEKKERIAFFCANDEVCRLTEHLAFTEPYMAAERNRWTSPQLDDLAREIRADEALKRAVSRLKLRFMAEPQALLHGNLHTGSVMVTETDTKVIDPAFAVFGPIGFDVGCLIGHLLLSYFSQPGHAPADAPRAAYERWIAETVSAVWQGFHDRFLGLWRSAHGGDAYPQALFAGEGGAESLRDGPARPHAPDLRGRAALRRRRDHPRDRSGATTCAISSRSRTARGAPPPSARRCCWRAS